MPSDALLRTNVYVQGFFITFLQICLLLLQNGLIGCFDYKKGFYIDNPNSQPYLYPRLHLLGWETGETPETSFDTELLVAKAAIYNYLLHDNPIICYDAMYGAFLQSFVSLSF
jgi:hypothetical protein